MKKTILFYVLALILSVQTFAQSVFSFQGENVMPGTKKHFTVSVGKGKTHSILPITVFNGNKDGAVLGITAGVHGYEYPPIIAAQKLIKSINPKSLSGVVILVQVANVEAFLNRTPFVNPVDKENLNRSFPGTKKGTLTSQIAHFISKKVIARSDYFLDMHGGDASEDLTAYSAYYQHKLKPKISEKGKEMAVALGFDKIVVFNTTGKSYMDSKKPSLYCSAEAFKNNIPAIDIECGKLGQINDKEVSVIENAVFQLLASLGMQQERKQLSLNSEAIFIKNRSFIESVNNGIFYAEKTAGEYVVKGSRLGYITDFFGNKKQTIYADSNGVILLIVGTPPINK